MISMLLCSFVLVDPATIEMASFKVTLPVAWKSEKPSNRLRSHQFKFKSGEESLADAELIVSPQANPDPAKSFPSWQKTFDPPDGKTLDEVTKKSKHTSGRATIHVLDVNGTWNYRERPQDPKSKLEVRPEYRAVWMIVVVGDEAWQVRFSGPQSVVAKAEADIRKAFQLATP